MVTPKVILLVCCLVLVMGLLYVLPARGERPAVYCRDDQVSIKGLDRVQVLRELWRKQQVHGFGGFDGGILDDWTPDSLEYAREAVMRYIDYFQGRAIKMYLIADCIDPQLYDRDTSWKAKDTIAKLRERMNPS